MQKSKCGPSNHSAKVLVVALAMLLCLSGCSGVDESPHSPAVPEGQGVISLARTSWSLASLTADPMAGGEPARTFDASDRVGTTRWFQPVSPVLRRYQEPGLPEAAGAEIIPTLELYLRAEADTWGETDWGGIMCSPTVTGVGFPDMSGVAWLDIWVNDGNVEPEQRSGRLHIDFGRLDEDGFWPRDGEGQLVTDDFDQEDGINSGVPDGVWVQPEEDVGLDRCGDQWGCSFSVEYEIAGDAPYPQINMTARNGREDTEDIDQNGHWDRANSYFTYLIDLGATVPLVDVVLDYDDVQDLVAEGIAWRLYRIPIRRSAVVVAPSGTPDFANVRHFRVWFEDASPEEPTVRRMQLAGIRFHQEGSLSK